VCARCCDTSACVRAAVPCARAAASAVRVCCCVVRACCCACSACLLLRGCCCCVGRARSVRACVLLSRTTPGPFCRIRTFIPRGLETMVGLNPYHVVALRRRFGRPLRSPEARFIDFGRLYPGGGKQWSAPTPTLLWRCDVGPVGARSVRAVCCLSREQSARACCCVVCACCCDTSACVRATASAVRARCGVVRACCCDGSACVLLRLQCVGAVAASAVRGLSVRACCCLGRPPARFVESGRLYPGGWKQWSASTPTMSWHCAVGSAGRYGRPRPVSSISDVYTQEVGNNGRHQPLPCCGVAPSARGLSVLSAPCPECSLRVRAAVSCARAAASAVRGSSCVGPSLVRACVLRRPCAVCPSVRACCCLGRPRPVPRVSGVYTPVVGNNGRQQPLPCCPVGPVGRLGRPRTVSSISDVYTQEVGNNGRHQPLLCCGVAMSGRSVHGLSVLCVLPLPCAVCACVRAAASPVRAAGSAVRGRAPLRRPCCACCCCWNPIDSPRWSLPVRSGRLCPPPFDPSSIFRQPLRRRRSKSDVWSGVLPCRGGMCAVIGRVANGGPLLRRAAAPCIAPSPSPLGPAALAAPRFECLYSYRFCGRRPLR